METLIYWVVCTTLFLLLRMMILLLRMMILLYSIVGTTITLCNCVDIMSARPDIITLCEVAFSVLILTL